MLEIGCLVHNTGISTRLEAAAAVTLYDGGAEGTLVPISCARIRLLLLVEGADTLLSDKLGLLCILVLLPVDDALIFPLCVLGDVLAMSGSLLQGVLIVFEVINGLRVLLLGHNLIFTGITIGSQLFVDLQLIFRLEAQSSPLWVVSDNLGIVGRRLRDPAGLRLEIWRRGEAGLIVRQRIHRAWDLPLLDG